MYKFLFSMIGLALVFTACKQREIDAHLKLWYDEPATVWTEALPVGNGRIGGMVYGYPLREVIQFNEETLWTGEPHEYQHTGAHIYLDTLRQLLFEGKQREADQLAMQEFMSVPLRQKAYQPFGDLIIEMAGIEETEDYHRELDLEQAMSRVSFTAKGLQYHREVWVSWQSGLQ